MVGIDPVSDKRVHKPQTYVCGETGGHNLSETADIIVVPVDPERPSIDGVSHHPCTSYCTIVLHCTFFVVHIVL